MSKNISIKERNQNLKYKTTVLKTALQDGGYCEWVPESEVETETLRAYSNGYYVPDKYAYSQAVVNVPAIFVQGMEGLDQMIYSLDIDGVIISEIVPIDFPDISTNPFIMEDLRIITIDPTTGEKFDITFPEEFEPMNSLLSPLSNDWLIADIGDVTQIISHPDGINTTPFVDPVDTSGAQIPVVDVNLDNNYIIGVDDLGNFHVASISTEGFVSTTMLGFTPTTFAFDANGMMEGFDANGNSMVAILNDGTVTQESHVPARIAIIQPPFNVRYHDGDTIDYTGIRVGAYKSNNDPFVFTDGEGSNKNEIPFADLTFPVTTAVPDVVFPDYQRSGTITVASLYDPVAVYNALLAESIVSFEFENGVDSELQTFLTNAAGHFFAAWVRSSDTEFYGSSPMSLIYFDSIISVGDTIFLGTGASGHLFTTTGRQSSGELVNTITGCEVRSQSSLPTFIGKTEDGSGHIVASNVNASASTTGSVSIPVRWQSQYRAEAFTTTFDIILTGGGG